MMKRTEQLADDLLIEILSRLPTKSLHRFRCVSKAWNTLIAQVYSYRKTLLPIAGFLTPQGFYVSVSPCGAEVGRRLRNLPFSSTGYLMNSCNGLFLYMLKAKRKTMSLYYVWNSATMESVALPELPCRRGSRKDCYLAYDPCQSPHYKMVRFTSTHTTSYIIVEIYSSITGRWAKFDVPREYAVSIAACCNVSLFRRGAVYLLSNICSENLIRFDMEIRGFQLIKLPEKRPECYSYLNVDCIGESRGCLHYMVKSSTDLELRIYMLEELDTSKWVLTHKISTDNEIFSDNVLPIGFDPESEVIYLSVPQKILVYHPCNGLLEEIDCNPPMCWRRVILINCCLESIDPPGAKFIK